MASRIFFPFLFKVQCEIPFLDAVITDGVQNLLPIPGLLDRLTRHAKFHRIDLRGQRSLQKDVEADGLVTYNAVLEVQLLFVDVDQQLRYERG
jgi:hypothetical protein